MVHYKMRKLCTEISYTHPNRRRRDYRDRCFPPLVVSTTVLSTTVFSTTVLSTTVLSTTGFFPPLVVLLPNYPNQISHTVISCIMNLACEWYLISPYIF